VRGNINNIEHLCRRRLGPTATRDLVEFESTLRGYSQKDSKLVSLEWGWTTIPKKNRPSQYPQFLPNIKQEIQLKKTIKETGKPQEITYSAFDGH
jgi:hypothetical protein